LQWRPTTYVEAALFALAFGVLTMVVVWATHPRNIGSAIAIGMVVALLNLGVRAARIWDRSSTDDM
jgi:hypothetical protein